MLKKLTVICGLLLAATAAMADHDPWPWVELDPTPFPVGYDAHIVCGGGRIWGMFNSADTETFVWSYSPLSTDINVSPDIGEWDTLQSGESGWFGTALTYTGMTFDWNRNALFVIGADTTDPEYGPDGTLYRYTLDSGWTEIEIEEDTANNDPEDLDFFLDSGACITYAPNLGYSAMNQTDGYIYCLPGGSREFWCYSLQPGADIVTSGIFPPDGSTIADQTPLFQWTGMANQYRLQVSTDPLFMPGTFVIDTVVSAKQYQTQSKLDSATYYRRTGTPVGGGNWYFAAAFSFTDVGGWTKLHPIDEKVHGGAAMAYYGGHPAWPVDPAIYALVGGNMHFGFYGWNFAEGDWDQLLNAPKDEWVGTSLATSPTGGDGWHAVAVFGGSVAGANRPFGYEPGGQEWFEYETTEVRAFPQTIGPGGTYVLGPNPWGYLVTGATNAHPEGTNYFYAIDPRYKKPKKDKDEGGSQAGDVLAGTAQARVIASHDGIEIEYQLPAAARVRATVHDAVGRRLGVLDVGSQQPGTHRLSWNQGRGGRRLASGAYFVLLDMGVEKATLKAIIR